MANMAFDPHILAKMVAIRKAKQAGSPYDPYGGGGPGRAGYGGPMGPGGAPILGGGGSGPHGPGPTGPGGAPIDVGSHVPPGMFGGDEPQPRDPAYMNEGRAGISGDQWTTMLHQLALARRVGVGGITDPTGHDPAYVMNKYHAALPKLIRLAEAAGFFGKGSIWKYLGSLKPENQLGGIKGGGGGKVRPAPAKHRKPPRRKGPVRSTAKKK